MSRKDCCTRLCTKSNLLLISRSKVPFTRRAPRKLSTKKFVTIYCKTKPPTITIGGFLIGRNQAISCLELSGGGARESNPPTLLVTRHNGFEVRQWAYQWGFLTPLRSKSMPRTPQSVQLVVSSGGKYNHILAPQLFGYRPPAPQAVRAPEPVPELVGLT